MADIGKVLELINKARTATGKPTIAAIPVGWPGNRLNCPLARALDGGKVQVGTTRATFQTEQEAKAVADAWGNYVEYDYAGSNYHGFVQVPLPEVMREFVRAFDDDKLPEYKDPNPDPDKAAVYQGLGAKA